MTLEEATDRFGLSEAVREGRVDGHLFFLVQEPGSFRKPTELVRPAVVPRPGETAFVLGKVGAEWVYLGVAREEGEGVWRTTPNSLGER